MKMGSTITIHQPNYLPWIGLFSKTAHADCLILADTMPFTKRSVTARSKIRTNFGWHYLTIPINKSFELAKITDVRLPQDNGWKREHWKLINDSYGRARFFGQHAEFFRELYDKDYTYLWQMNEAIIHYFLKCFEIDAQVIRASEMDADYALRRTDLIIQLLRKVGADTYLSGPSGRTYLEPEKFSQNGIGLGFFDFQHPVYSQRFPGFEPNMSALDLLFNLGPQSGAVIRAVGALSRFRDGK